MEPFRSIEKYIRVSVILNVLPWVILLSGYTAGLVAIDRFVFRIGSINLPFQASLTIVVGTLLVFRTNTAYERFREGRRYWASMVAQSKNLARIMWVNVQPGIRHKDGTGEISDDMIHREKTNVLKNLMLFLHSSVSALRNHRDVSTVCEEYFIRDPVEDQLFFHSPARITQKVIMETRIVDEESIRIQMKDDVLGLCGVMIPPDPMDMLEDISRFLHRHARNEKYKTLDNTLANNLEMNIVNSLSDSLHGCLRIRTTPLPRGYQIILHHLLGIYCLTLPLAFISQYVWWSIPIAAIIQFVFIGVYAIAMEIQNPFGDDENDLPMERYVFDVELEVKRLLKSEQDRRMSFAPQ